MIKEFALNKVLREAVRSYMQGVFNQEIITRVHNREDVSHIADAEELVDKAFEQMSIDYEPKKEIKNINEAR